MTDFAAPILPSADFDRTVTFYGHFGFDVGVRIDPPQSPYLILYRGPIWLHFFRHEHDPFSSNFMTYLHLDDPDAWANEIRQLALPNEGIPRFMDIENKPWGMREFAVIDPDGTLIRAGRDASEEAP